MHTIFIKAMYGIIRQIIFVFNNFIAFIIFFYPLFRASPNGEYSNLACTIILGLYPKSSPVKYSYLSNSLDNNAEILAASL